MAKRRTSGIQRRSRASDEALARRIGTRRGAALDWRLLAIGGILLVGVMVLALLFLFGGTGPGDGGGALGQHIHNDGQTHIPEGQQGGPYSSVPATSGPHWPPSATTPAQWGAYTTAEPQERMVHNLEHGGIVIWYQPAKLDAAGVAALTAFVNQQITTAQFKVVVTPWAGADFGHPIAVTAWTWLLYLDTPDLDAVRTFLDAHYGQAPEPFGGPAQPGS
ncbi:MAG: DUF3105 domain-containing protein [Chloroflexota bacterium]|nr:DUF3105 domain-containing protein [Chloroflexota bacterium]